LYLELLKIASVWPKISGLRGKLVADGGNVCDFGKIVVQYIMDEFLSCVTLHVKASWYILFYLKGFKGCDLVFVIVVT
jgi:hypothetical protein